MRGFTGNQELSPIGTINTATTFEGRLREEKVSLEKRLASVNEVLKQLEKNPDMAKFVEALSKLGY